MTIEQLHNKLIELNISEDRYYLHGLYGSTDDNDKISLVIKKGKYTIEYEVYHKERGEKDSVNIFFDESEACEWILKKFIDEQSIIKKFNLNT